MYIVTISFRDHRDFSHNLISSIIFAIPGTYKTGHTQGKVANALLNKGTSYDIEFKNQESAENFASELFQHYGNILNIIRSYK